MNTCLLKAQNWCKWLNTNICSWWPNPLQVFNLYTLLNILECNTRCIPNYNYSNHWRFDYEVFGFCFLQLLQLPKVIVYKAWYMFVLWRRLCESTTYDRNPLIDILSGSREAYAILKVLRQCKSLKNNNDNVSGQSVNFEGLKDFH